MLKIKKIIKSFIFQPIYLLALFKYGLRRKQTAGDKRLLIIKIDAIGDYILFRNFLEEIKNSDIYKDYKITFLGNIVVKDLAENLDGKFIDDFIWISRKKIFKGPLSIFKIINLIRGRFSIVIQPTYSREFVSDLLVRFSGAETRVGFNGDCNNISLIEKKESDKWYSELISINPKINFEFYKNRSFFSQILKKNLVIKKPFINSDKVIIDNSILLPDNFVVFFPGASQEGKEWPAHNFQSVANFLIKKYNLDIVICGSKQDNVLGNIINADNNKRIIDSTGKSNLLQLIFIISKAKLVVSNDTSGAHIGAALNIPTIVLSRFNHYRRFVPYPKEISDKMICLTSHIFNNFSEEEKIKKFQFGSNEDISLISVEEVEQVINGIL